jgi:NDP-sugar pyrophosphorylase family protein
MQIVIPMAGLGSRFQNAGFKHPKPFIEFLGKSMIEHVIENLGVSNDFIIVMQKQHWKDYSHVFARLTEKVSSIDAVLIDKTTNGAAETCLLAINKIDHQAPMMIANCDQIMEWNHYDFRTWFLTSGLDGAICTFDSQSIKNSYAELDANGLVVRTAEKQVISPHATTGIYTWKKASNYFSAAEEMIIQGKKTNNEFYVCPVYNINVERGEKIGLYHIKKHWPIGTPPDLVNWLSYEATKK